MREIPPQKPCPFCGSDDTVDMMITDPDDSYVECNTCKAKGPLCVTGLLARIMWNSTAREPRIPQHMLHNLDVSALRPSARLENILAAHGLNRLGDIVSKSADDLLKLKNFGPLVCRELEGKLAEFGMRLREDD